jgi:hypothetical protein
MRTITPRSLSPKNGRKKISGTARKQTLETYLFEQWIITGPGRLYLPHHHHSLDDTLFSRFVLSYRKGREESRSIIGRSSTEAFFLKKTDPETELKNYFKT